MKKITLHGPTVRNNGAFVDAGATLIVGDGSEHITLTRAKALCSRGMAIAVAAPAAVQSAE